MNLYTIPQPHNSEELVSLGPRCCIFIQVTRPPDNSALSFGVRRLYVRGTRLQTRVVERSVPVIGSLNLIALRYPDQRSMYVLELLDARNGIQPRLIPSLHDPQLLTLGALGMLLRGIEVIELRDQVIECVQEWHVTFMLQTGGHDEHSAPRSRA